MSQRMSTCHDTGRASLPCPGELVCKLMLPSAVVLRCLECGALTYVAEKPARSRVRSALTSVIEWLARDLTGNGTWLYYP